MSALVPVALGLLIVIPVIFASDDSRAWLFGGACYAVAVGFWALARRLAPRQLLGGACGAGIGLALVFFASPLVRALADSPAGREILTVGLTLAAFIVGAGLGVEKATARTSSGAPGDSAMVGLSVAPKICDTSVLIDGRIAEMAEAGFIDGELIIPEFILHELQGIADAADQLRRNRGRRGLDIVKRLQQVEGLKVSISGAPYRDEPEVDSKLIRLATDIGAGLFTNDYNLNKVAQVKNIKVLNLNDLINALKAIFLPGETIVACITGTGKEPGQGVAYLEDGTMVVVDSGSAHTGKNVRAIVTNIYQTGAGRIIFTKFEGLAAKDHRDRA